MKFRGRWNLHRLLLALPILWLLELGTAFPDEIRLRVHHFLGEESTPHRSLIEPWAERIARDSNGVIEAEIYPAMELGGKAPELVDQVRTGAVDVIWTAAAYTPADFPRTGVFTLPLVHQGDPVATNLAILELLGEDLASDYEGIHPLLVHVHAGHAFHLAGRAVARLDDFQGLVLRPPGRGTGLWTIEALGAQATKKRHPKLPRALQQGDLDGALMSFQLAESMGVVEAVESHTLVEDGRYFGTSLYLFLMNKARYDALPKELRFVIDRNSGHPLAREMGRVWHDGAEDALRKAGERGNAIHVLQGEESTRAKQALQQVLTRWRTEVGKQGIDGTRLIDRARGAIARNNRTETQDGRR